MEIETWTLQGALDEIATINEQVPERSYAFVLGSGASVSSGIPSGAALADRWLRELYERTSEIGFEDWVRQGHSGIDGLTAATTAECYSQIFERRFRGDRESGYAYLEAIMEGREPSLGYSLLAEVMEQTRHKVVITTNFDNLVADALAIHAHRPPLVVGHETLTGFVRSTQRRPLVAKIHRDLLYEPKNDLDGVSTLEQGWHDALKKLLLSHTPLVIGYGGNDGSLMGFLSGLEVGAIAGRMFWCQRLGSTPSKRVSDVLRRHGGVVVPITGFDEFMLRLTPSLIRDFDLSRIAVRLERMGLRRANRYRGQVETIRRRTEAPNILPRGSDLDRQSVKRALGIALRDERNWWTWEMRARSEEDLQKRSEIYEEGLRKLPKSAELVSFLARHQQTLGNLEDAERLHQDSVRMRPDDVHVLLAYAEFLDQHRRDLVRAKQAYLAAIAIDPTHVEALARYAHFLAYRLRETGDADATFGRAIEVDPKDPIVTRNYARFLIAEQHDVPRASRMYKRAVDLNPGHAETIGNYAYFLDREEKTRANDAEELYRLSLRLDRNIPLTLTNYGLFLLTRRRDIAGAEQHFVEALSLLPNDSACVGNYVSLLLNHRGDWRAAESLVQKACVHAPDSANNFANLAGVLLCQKRYVEAGEAARRAVALEGPKVSQSLAEALLYEALVCKALAEPFDGVLGRLKGLLRRGFPRVYWEFGAVLEGVVGEDSSADGSLFHLIADAVLDRLAVRPLDANAAWARIEAVDPVQPAADK